MAIKRASPKDQDPAKGAQLDLAQIKGAENSGLPRLAYTLQETGKILGISYISVYRLTKRRKLKCSAALPGRKLIPASEILSFLARTAE